MLPEDKKAGVSHHLRRGAQSDFLIGPPPPKNNTRLPFPSDGWNLLMHTPTIPSLRCPAKTGFPRVLLCFMNYWTDFWQKEKGVGWINPEEQSKHITLLSEFGDDNTDNGSGGNLDSGSDAEKLFGEKGDCERRCDL